MVTNYKNEFEKLLEEAYRVSRDAGLIVEETLKDAIANPMDRNEVESLLTAVINKLKKGAIDRKDDETLKTLEQKMEKIIQKAIDFREDVLRESNKGKHKKVVELTRFNNEEPAPVHPRPTFHKREIPMMCGGVKTRDIVLRETNERLDIHVGQFIATIGRTPSSEELLDIMLSKMSLPGLNGKDQFKIADLARSIANNGVRKPPIIDIDGTLLDGNRRVAACYYILNSDDFDFEQKKRAENIFVWQLTEFATDDDRNAVVVSLNFEPDNKQDWDEYVKAHIIYDEWQAILARELRTPGAARTTLLKKDLALQFGYSEKDWDKVNRYIRMVTWSDDFEDYLVQVKQFDAFTVKHQANKYFQYFDELSKGIAEGSVAVILSKDETLKHLVFELLFQGKFVNFKLIRYLKYYNDDVVEEMVRARDTTDVSMAQDMVTRKLESANVEQAQSRSGNANHRIMVFSNWLVKVPIGDFQDETVIKPESLRRLREALKIVERQIENID